MTRIAVVGAAWPLGHALSRHLTARARVHAIRRWDQPRSTIGVDKIAVLTDCTSLFDALNGCRFAVWCCAFDELADDFVFAQELSQAVRAFLQACREAQIQRAVVVLSASTMVDQDQLSETHYYTPGDGSIRDDAMYMSEQDIARFRADAMDVCTLNCLPIGDRSGDTGWVTSIEDAVLAVDARLLDSNGPFRVLAPFGRGRPMLGAPNPLFQMPHPDSR